LNKLCILNNKLLRILSKAKLDSPVKCLYTFQNVLPIPLLHKLQLLIFVQKCLYHKYLLPDVFNNYFSAESAAVGLLFFTAQETNLIYSLIRLPHLMVKETLCLNVVNCGSNYPLI